MAQATTRLPQIAMKYGKPSSVAGFGQIPLDFGEKKETLAQSGDVEETGELLPGFEEPADGSSERAEANLLD